MVWDALPAERRGEMPILAELYRRSHGPTGLLDTCLWQVYNGTDQNFG